MKYRRLIQELEGRKKHEEGQLEVINLKVQKGEERLENKRKSLEQVEIDNKEFEYMCGILENDNAKKEARKDFWQEALKNVLESVVCIILGLIAIGGLGGIFSFAAGAYMVLFGGVASVVAAIRFLFDYKVVSKWRIYKEVKRIRKENVLSDVNRALKQFDISRKYLEEGIKKIKEELDSLQVSRENKQQIIDELNRRLIEVIEQLELAMATSEAEAVLDKHFDENTLMRTLEKE